MSKGDARLNWKEKFLSFQKVRNHHEPEKKMMYKIYFCFQKYQTQTQTHKKKSVVKSWASREGKEKKRKKREQLT